jgi:hypothetical protein
LIRKSRATNDTETKIEEDGMVWKFGLSWESEDTLTIGDELKSPEEIRKREELDDVNHPWTNTRCKKFIQQKITNILEFQDLCARSK